MPNSILDLFTQPNYFPDSTGQSNYMEKLLLSSATQPTPDVEPVEPEISRKAMIMAALGDALQMYAQGQNPRFQARPAAPMLQALAERRAQRATAQKERSAERDAESKRQQAGDAVPDDA